MATPEPDETFAMKALLESGIPLSVYQDRVKLFSEAGAVLSLARELGRSSLSDKAALRLIRHCPDELIHRIAT